MQSRHIFIVVLLLGLAGLAAMLWLRLPEPPAAVESPLPAADSETPAEPATPRYPLPEAEPRDRPALQPLPALDESDEYFKLELTDLLGEQVAERIASTALIERFVATIDNLTRQQVAERLRPVEAPESAFAVAGQDDSGEYQLSRDNYRRYDLLVAQFEQLEPAAAMELYRRFYPLLQKAYEGLGYPDGYFNDRLVEVIDHLLATPEVEEPIMLVRPHVLYRYADDDLEALSAGQKLMIRIGPGHRETVRAKLSELRRRLVDQGAG